MTQEALKLALEALEAMNPYPASKEEQRTTAITAIKEALAQPEQILPSVYSNTHQPEQEPVACKTLCELCVKRGYIFCANAVKTTPIPFPPQWRWVGSGDLEDSNAYLTPPQRTWVNLTYEQVAEIYNKHGRPPPVNMFMIIDIENKIQELNP